jgi:hypothetical protein
LSATVVGGATKVTTTSTSPPIQIVNDGGSNNIADQATCDARRCGTSPSAYTWSDGKYCDASDQVNSVGLVQAYYTEVMFCIQGLPAAAGNMYYFWVYPIGTEADSYDGSNTATIAFASSGGNINKVGGETYADASKVGGVAKASIAKIGGVENRAA